MIGVVDALWARIDGGRLDVAVPVEDVDLLGDVMAGAPPTVLDRELLAVVRPNDLVFDLGASVGRFALAAAACGARVVAVEASPRRVDHLRLSATVNGLNSVAIVHAAVGRNAGTGRYLTRRSVRRLVEGSSSNDLVAIPMTTVAELVARHGSPDLVRVHAPGWEIDALATLDGATTIGVGADLAALAARGQHVRSLAALLTARQRALTWLDGRNRRPFDAALPHPEARLDLLAAPARPTGDALGGDERIIRCEAEAARNPGAVRARLAADLRDGGELLDDPRLQAVLERLLLDPAELVVRAATWWRVHPARHTTLVDRGRALRSVLATRLSLD